jgi:hypothetical protein
MPCFQPGVGTTAKYGGKTLQGYFQFAKTDAVTNTQRDFPDANPAIVSLKEYTVAGVGVLQADQAAFIHFNATMEPGNPAVLQGKVA